MAQVTIELRHLIEYTDFKLFDFDYTVDDPQFKANLEEHITEFYYDYEIGQETPKMFKRKFKARFLRVIGFYNELYNTTLLSYNPLTNYKISEKLDQESISNATGDNNVVVDNTQNGKTTSTNTTETNQNGSQTSNTKSSDYPQQPISGGDFLNGEQQVEQTDNVGGTATNTAISNNEDAGNTKTVGATNTTETTSNDYIKTIEGITGTSYQDLITKQRSLIINIYDMIINDLKPCFILVF